MADQDANTTQQTEGEGGSTPVGEGESDAGPPSLSDQVAMTDEQLAALPEDQRHPDIEDFRGIVGTARTEASTDASKTLQQQLAKQQQSSAATQQQNVAAQADIDYYNDLQTRLTSSDDEVAAAARSEALIPENATRARLGAARLHQQGENAQLGQALEALLTHMGVQLEQAGMAGVLPPQNSVEWALLAPKLAEFDGKGGIAAYLIDHGKQLGIEEGRKLATEEFERKGRIDRGAGGATNLGNGNSGSYTGGDVDLNKSAKELMRQGLRANAKAHAGARR
ncbi:MAG: hypothetical protein IIC73_08995 [Armatimonadetes bacterium]|nr:hypothetical protein [Armatimonadota bacterium]